MTDKCMLSPNTMEELAKIRKQAPNNVTLYHHPSCPHCRALHPVMEEECKKVDPSKAKIIDCPVDKEFCRLEATAHEARGIPLTVDSSKGNAPVKIEGNIPSDVKQLLGKYK